MTPEKRDIAVQYVAAGNFIGVALGAAGIGLRTYQQWKKRCEDGDEEAISRYGNFFRALEEAKREAECKAVGVITKGEQNWQSRAWFLERKAQKRWGKKDQPPTIKLNLAAMSTADLEELAASTNSIPVLRRLQERREQSGESPLQ